MVVANIDDSEELTIQGTYKKSTIVERNGRKIGIIGVILQTTDVSGFKKELVNILPTVLSNRFPIFF